LPKRLAWVDLLLPVVGGLVLLADQVSKHLVTTRLPVGHSWDMAPWLRPIFSVTHVTNTGAAFGLLQKWGAYFAVVAVVVVIAIILYYRHIPREQWLMRVALGFQLGGALGNLTDRLRHQLAVVDFIDLNFWPLHNWPVFNLADASVVTGTIILAFLLLREEQFAREEQRLAEGSGG
jgi:signal peptidase II